MLTNKKKKVGVVVGKKTAKTVMVEVKRTVQDKTFKKYLTMHAKMMAHDEKNESKLGDTVEIVECRPISKRKRWRLKQVLKAGKITDELRIVNDSTTDNAGRG